MTKVIWVALGLLLAYSGAMLLWQLGAQPNVNGCYMFPFGFGALAAPYQNGCGYNQVPNYYAGDVGMTTIILGFFLVIWGMSKGRR